MHAIPPIVPGLKVDATGQYVCPLCNVQHAGDDVDTGWVECPMLGNRMICLGSCIDYQNIARSADFDVHPEIRLFRELAQVTHDDIEVLRWTCLRHQAKVIDDQLWAGSEDAAPLRELRDSVTTLLRLV